jgi:hypothetical protein
MRTSRRSLLSVALATGLLATVLGFVPAAAQVPGADPTVASVDVKNILAGVANQEFKVTVSHRAGDDINAVIVGTPPGGYVLTEGRAPGWQALIISDREVLFTGGSIPLQSSATFSMFANVPRTAQDLTSRWVAQVSSDGGITSADAGPSSTGAMDTTIRVLQVTSLGITAPAGATDNGITGAQDNVDTVCNVQNVGSGLLSTTARLASRDGRFDSADSSAANIGPGATQSFTFRLQNVDDVTSNSSDRATCSASASGASTGPFTKNFDLTVQPRALFDYVATSLSPRMAAPTAAPIFSVRVNKHQNGQVSLTGSDQSPAATLEAPSALGAANGTDFKLSGGPCNIGPTALGAPTTVDAGRRDNVLLQFAPLSIPLGTNDGDCNVVINVGGTDANGAKISIRPLPNTLDTVRIDAAIPIIQTLRLQGPESRCCNADPAVKNNDTLNVAGAVTDRNPSTGQQEPCSTCQVVRAELIQYNQEDGNGTEAGPRIPVNISNTGGTLSGSYAGAYAAATRSVRMALVMKDEAGNLSAETLSTPFDVDNIAPVITGAVATQAPSVANADLQRQLRATFSEPVDNFDRPVDGVCPGADWRADNNTVVNCSRDPNFLGTGLLVANRLAEDGPDLGALSYFPQTPLSFHDRVGIPIRVGDGATILDRIPPKAPVLTKVSGRTADSDGKFYTTESNTPFELTNPPASSPLGDTPAVKAGYTVQLWRENGLQEGLQAGGTNSDQQIGTAVAQGPTVTVTGNGLPGDSCAQAGKESTVYARSLDTASPANPTPDNQIRAFQVVVDTVKPALLTAAAQVDRVNVGFGGTAPTGCPAGSGGPEAVVGRDAPFDWQIQSDAGDLLNRNRVEGTGSSRDVVMNDGRYSAATVGLIRYRFVGTPPERYRDKAGNTVDDNTKLI